MTEMVSQKSVEDTYVWLGPFGSGRFPQACCNCGKPVKVNHIRYIISNSTKPFNVATMRHENCEKRINYNKHGEPVSFDGYNKVYRRVQFVGGQA
jgi:hypothetical protein